MSTAKAELKAQPAFSKIPLRPALGYLAHFRAHSPQPRDMGGGRDRPQFFASSATIDALLLVEYPVGGF